MVSRNDAGLPVADGAHGVMDRGGSPVRGPHRVDDGADQLMPGELTMVEFDHLIQRIRHGTPEEATAARDTLHRSYLGLLFDLDRLRNGKNVR